MTESTRFHLPYNFVPVDTRTTPTQSADAIAAGSGTHPARHDIWNSSCHSGRILCELRTDTPLVIGGRQHREADSRSRGTHNGPGEVPATVEPYRRDGRIAIPGSTLRGMVGSIAEALSQSALRKLDGKKAYSFLIYGKGTHNVPGNLYDAFRRSGGDNALPWGATWKASDRKMVTRTKLTPAELLFGVAADDGGTDDDYLAALAGRVSFSDAVLPDGPDAPRSEPITLQTLGSPSAKSPTFYFSQQAGHGLGKTELDLGEHSPNGRKTYVLHQASGGRDTWQHRGGPDKFDKLRLTVRPIAAGTRFYFAIDFDNLSEAELHLLLTALQPDERFIHRLGLGKPLGLGHVRVDVKAVCRLSRAERYKATALSSPRYAQVQTVPGLADYAALRSWLAHPRYRDEHEAIFVAKTAITNITPSPAQLIGEPAQNLVDANTLEIVRTLGHRSYLDGPTHYPRCIGTGYAENNLYEWNVVNDNELQDKRQWLKPVVPGKKLPTLNRNRGKSSAGNSKKPPPGRRF